MQNKISIFTRYFYPVYSGSEANILNTYSFLAMGDWKVDVYTTKRTLTEKDILPSYERKNNIDIFRYNASFYNLLPLVKRVNLKKECLICLHTVDIFPNYFIFIQALFWKLARRKRARIVFTPHGLFDLEIAGASGFIIKVKTLIDHSIGVFLINNTVDLIRAVSKWERDFLVGKHLNERLIKVIENGLEKEAFLDAHQFAREDIKHTVKELGKYIIQIARVTETKNQEIPIRALKFIPEDVKLVLVGQDHSIEYKQKLMKLIKDLGVENRVNFLGFINGVDKYFLIRHAVAMVHMSKVEGFGNVVHEAMSQGVPCIVSRNTALTELIKNGINGYTLKVDDYLGVADKINYILSNSNATVVTKMKEYDRRRTQGHTWGNTAKKLESIYLSLLG